MISDFFIQSKQTTSILALAFFMVCLLCKPDFWLVLPFLIVPVVSTWIAWLFSTIFLGGALNRLGIYPRKWGGLWGLLFAPFLHDHTRADEADHLVGNTVAFMSFGGFIVMPRGVEDFLVITAVVALGSGLFTWLCGQSGSIHIGASGILYGYLGFLLLRGLYEHQVIPIMLSMLVLGFYHSLLWGIFPLFAGISWEMHFGGFVSGLLSACYLGAIKANASLLPSNVVHWLQHL